MNIDKNNICNLYLLLMKDVLAINISIRIGDRYIYFTRYNTNASLYKDYPHRYRSLQGYIDSKNENNN